MPVMTIDLMDPALAVGRRGRAAEPRSRCRTPYAASKPRRTFVLLVALAGLAGVALVYGIRTRSGAGGLVGPTGAITPTQSPLPLTWDDCWPMDEPFDFASSLVLSVA